MTDAAPATPPTPAQADWTYDPPPRDNAEDLARSDFWPRLWRPLVHVVWRGILRLLFRFRVQGRRRIPDGPFVIVANHSGHIDAPSLMAAVPLRRVNTTHALAARDYFWRWRWTGALVHTVLNALPLDRTMRAEDALADAQALLAAGRSLILFPEGTRSTTGELGRFRQGIGHILAGTDVPVVPAAILGARDILPKGATWPRLKRLTIRLGRPVSYPDRHDTVEDWRAIAGDLEARVRSLLEAGP